MKRHWISTVKKILIFTFFVLAIIIGFSLYRVFLSYVPGGNIERLFKYKIGIPAFRFFGISAGILICFPVLISAFAIYEKFAASYIQVMTDKGNILLSDNSIASFVHDTVSQIAGVDTVEVKVNFLKEKAIGLNLWLDTDEKNDFIRFSERIQQRVLQDLEFNFGITKVKYFNVYIESTDINSAGAGYKVEYK